MLKNTSYQKSNKSASCGSSMDVIKNSNHTKHKGLINPTHYFHTVQILPTHHYFIHSNLLFVRFTNQIMHFPYYSYSKIR